MPTQIQWRRGNTAQTAAFTGALAEVTVDTDKKTLVVHDGVTAGGFTLALESAQQDALAYNKANGAYDKANSANIIAQNAYNQVNVAFDVANTKYSAAGGTIAGNVLVSGNVTPTTDNDKYLGSSLYRWHTVFVGPGSIDIDGIKIQNTAGKLTVSGATELVIPGAPSTKGISDRANLAFDTANTALLSTGAFAQANAAFDKANSAYDQAIVGTNIAGLAFNQANSGTGIATSGFAQANLAYNKANSATILAQGAYDAANNVAPQIQPTYDKANNAFAQANIAFTKANSAYELANNVAPQVQPAFDKANGAYTQANTATVLAQDAYDRANTKVSSSGGTFTGPVIINSDLTVSGNVSYTGNVTSVQITGNTGQFFGDAANGFQALYAGIPTGYTFQEQTVIQSTGNYDGFIQFNIQNINTGQNASTDLVATNDNQAGDAYIDIGINSTTYDDPEYELQHANDGYVYVRANTDYAGGNLVFSTTASGRDIIFSTGGTTHANEIARFKDGVGLVMQGKPIKFADATTQNTAAASVAHTDNIFNQANLAYSQANSGTGIATSGFAQANLAYTKANSAYDLASNVAPQVQPAFDKANSAFDVAGLAYGAANTKVSKSGDTMSGTLIVPTLTANSSVTINSVGTLIATTLTTTSNAQVTLDSFSNTAIRSAKYQIQMENYDSYHSTEIGLIHNGTTSYINQYGDLMTNGSLGTFDTTITSGVVKLLFTPANTTNTIVSAVRTSMPFTVTTAPAGGGGTPFITGTLTVGTENLGWAIGYGYADFGNGIIGSITSSPSSMIYSLSFLDAPSDAFTVNFNTGTYGSIEVTTGTIDGKSNISMTIDGVTVTGQIVDNMMGRPVYSVSGSGSDVFSLASKVGQTLNFSMTMTS